jgi:hypothetical protein
MEMIHGQVHLENINHVLAVLKDIIDVQVILEDT